MSIGHVLNSFEITDVLDIATGSVAFVSYRASCQCCHGSWEVTEESEATALKARLRLERCTTRTPREGTD